MTDPNNKLKREFDYLLNNSDLDPPTQQNVAKALNVSAATVSRWLSGTLNWPHSDFRRACDLLKLNEEERTQLWELVSAQREKYLESQPIKSERLPRAEHSELTKELVDYYVELIADQKKRGIKGYIRLNADRHHILDILAKCVEEKEWQAAIDLSQAIDDFLNDQGHWTERLTANKIGLQAAQKLNNYYYECVFLGSLGRTWDVLGKIDKAIELFDQALVISGKIDDRASQVCKSQILDYRGSAYRHKWQVEKVLQYYEKAIEDYKNARIVAEKIKDYGGQDRSLCSLGRIYTEIGPVEWAIEYIEQALKIARNDLKDPRRESIDLGYLGDAYMAKWKGEKTIESVEKAIEYYENARKIAEEVDDLRGKGKQLLGLGNAYRELKQVEQARKYYEEAREIARKIGDVRMEREAQAGLDQLRNTPGGRLSHPFKLD